MDESVDGNSNNEVNIEPIDVLVPVRTRDGLISDMRLFWVVLFIPIGLRYLSRRGQ